MEDLFSSNFSNGSLTLNANHSNSGPKFMDDNPLFWSLIVFAVLVITLNGTVFVVFFRQPRLRTATNWILVSLAVSDFSVGLSTPLLIMCRRLPLPDKIPYCLASVCLNRVFAVATIYHITLATVEKYIAIVHPFKHISFRKRLVFGTLVSIWIFAAFVAFIPLSWALPYDKMKDESTYAKQRVYTLVVIPLVLLIPYLLIVYMFGKIFIKASSSLMSRRNFQHVTTDFLPECPNKSCYNGHLCTMIRFGHRPLMIFVSMATLFAICWFPYFAYSLYAELRMRPLPGQVIQLCIAIRYITSTVHPLLYTIIKRDFTAAMKSSQTCSQPLHSMTALETVRQHTRIIEGRRSILLLSPSSPNGRSFSHLFLSGNNHTSTSSQTS